jgi:hypothetical protein
MRYYIVAEGRARTLDRLNLRDRATYGRDRMVFYASTAQDGLRQWEQFKAGTHIGQADLELEASRYRERRAGVRHRVGSRGTSHCLQRGGDA